ncbi:hypothetical protein KBA27_04080 [bacterium]|nr:hypothetical protein [bacterium]
MNNYLKLKHTAIGSLPCGDVKSAINIVKESIDVIPFWPQLANISKNEDMIVQFLEGFPGVRKNDEKETIYLDSESDDFFEELETFFMDYEEIIADTESKLLDKYAISENYSSSIRPYFDLISQEKPQFAKGQIVGAFTLATSLCDKNGRCAYYDETLKEVLTKGLTLKALWQIKQIKKVSPDTKPIIFMDEPSLSQLGTSAFITIPEEEVVEIIKSISDIIHENGALSAIHCCGKCAWDLPISTGIDIINLDGYFFAQNLSLFSDSIKNLFEKNGYIAWGIIPTLDKEALERATISEMIEKFEEAVSYLEKKGLDRKEIINHSMITPSCGAGGLTEDLAKKAMSLTKELSQNLIERYGD